VYPRSLLRRRRSGCKLGQAVNRLPQGPGESLQHGAQLNETTFGGRVIPCLPRPEPRIKGGGGLETGEPCKDSLRYSLKWKADDHEQEKNQADGKELRQRRAESISRLDGCLQRKISNGEQRNKENEEHPVHRVAGGKRPKAEPSVGHKAGEQGKREDRKEELCKRTQPYAGGVTTENERELIEKEIRRSATSIPARSHWRMARSRGMRARADALPSRHPRTTYATPSPALPI